MITLDMLKTKESKETALITVNPSFIKTTWEAYSEPRRTSKMECFAKMVNVF